MSRLPTRLAVDTLLVTSGRFGQYVITLITIPLLARVLGVHELGVLALGTAAYFYGSTFGDLGLTQALASASAGRSPIVSRGFFLILRLVLVGLSLVALLGISGFGSRRAVVVALGFTVGASTSLAEDWLLIARARYARLASAQFAGRLAYLGVLLILLAWRPRAESVLLSLAAGGLVTVALTHLFVSAGGSTVTATESSGRQEATGSWQKDAGIVKRLIFDITGQRVMNLTYNQGIALFLGPLVPAAALGLYSASDRCVRACQALLDGFGVALVGRLARHRSHDERFSSAATRALRAAFVLGALAAAALCLGSHVIVHVLFGSAFDGAADVLMLQSLLLIPVAVSTVATEAVLYVTGDTRGPFWATAFGIVMAASCIPLVLATRSPFALALSAVVGELGVAVFLLLRRRGRSRSSSTSNTFAGPGPEGAA
jgi:O-antigen/teichoic acid export membrane protein